jgi:Carboxypeptidase regulatory-like domain
MQRSVQKSPIIIFLLLFFTSSIISLAQAPVGTISGTITDPSGAVIKDAPIIVRNKATGVERRTKSEDDGTYSAPALPAGQYEVQVQMQGFRTLLREVTVTVGSIIKLDLAMEIGQTTEVVTVEAAGAAQINYESHSVDGVINRQKIQELPLNGRSFLNLAFLEPGVTVTPGTTSQYNSLFNVSVLGGESNKTAITVDGGNIRNSIEGNTGMNLSQEVVQEFQLSSANYDLSTGITSVGAVNIVTRSGGNEFHGSGYFFFRDHNMAAYPGLKRVCGETPTNPICANPESRKGVEDPFFVRRNPGVWVGGPIIKNRLFFFTNYEYTNQVQVFTVQPDLPSVQGLAGNFLSPYRGHLFSLKFDLRINDKHTLFARYSHDQNKGFGPQSGAPLPSNWLQNKNFSDQSVLGVTSVFTPTLTNDFRFNYTYWQNRNLFADENVCPGCLGLGFPDITTLLPSTNFRVGNTINATQGRDLRRFTFLDTVTWQKGSHRLRFGTEIEHAPGTGFWGFCDPGCVGVFSPEFIRANVPAPFIPALFPRLPSVIRTDQDLLNLPFISGAVGVGNPSQPPPYNIDKAKQNNRFRFFGQDTWKIKPHFTLNYGLSWNFESTLVNRDLDKPRYLAPLYGSDLSATDNNYNNFSPSVGFAWNVGSDNKTVVRGGAGIYWETELLWRRLQERALTGPIGNGRVPIPHTTFRNIFPGIINVATQQPIPIGAPLPAQGTLSTLTLGQFLEIYRQQVGAIGQSLTPTNPNDLTIRNIEVAKTGENLYPREYPVQRSYQFGIGIQRELSRDMVLSVDYVRRVFVNTLLGALDYNRFNRYINGVQSPVIPRCTAAQSSNPAAQCSNGIITFWTPAGRTVYNAMLVKLDKRFSNRYFFTGSYALTGRNGNNGPPGQPNVISLDNYFAGYGPQGSRHIFNFSGNVELPWGFQFSLISGFSSKEAVMPLVSNVDLDGDGIASEPLPNLKYNCFNRGCGKGELEAAIQRWNANFYPNGKPNGTTIPFRRDARGQSIPYLDPLPSGYELGDWFSSQDVRLTKKFSFKDRYQFSVFAEMFNIFNIANLSSFNYNVNSGTFGLPTQRQSQVFGSGGPRALQVGGRFTF